MTTDSLTSMVASRLAAATPQPDEWLGGLWTGTHAGYWPSGLEIVNVVDTKVRNAEIGFRLGRLESRGVVTRWVRRDRHPKELLPYLGDLGEVPWIFGLTYDVGQEDHEETRNLFASHTHGRYHESGWVWVYVELGCGHIYDDAGSNHNIGYHRGRCVKCGHEYMRDSSG